MQRLIERRKEKLLLTTSRLRQNECVDYLVGSPKSNHFHLTVTTLTILNRARTAAGGRNASLHSARNWGGNYSGQLPCRREAVPSIKSQECVTLHNSSHFGFSTLLLETKGSYITEAGLRRHVQLLRRGASSSATVTLDPWPRRDAADVPSPHPAFISLSSVG